MDSDPDHHHQPEIGRGEEEAAAAVGIGADETTAMVELVSWEEAMAARQGPLDTMGRARWAVSSARPLSLLLWSSYCNFSKKKNYCSLYLKKIMLWLKKTIKNVTILLKKRML